MVEEKLGKDYKNETVKMNFNEIKKPLIQEFKESLLTNKLKNLEEQLKEKQRNSSPVIRYYQSQESIRIERENQIEENNRKKASEELPEILNKVKNDFSTKLKENILAKKEVIEKELSNYSPLNLKIFLQNLTEKEKIKDILIMDSKNEIEKILLISYDDSYHFNIILLGKTGVGKSTLINGTFEFSDDNGAKTGEGRPITQNYEEFISDKRKGLRLIDSKGIEMGEYGIDAAFNSIKELIQSKAINGDPDKFIHCIWYCFKSDNLRFENIEKETLTLLMNQYNDNNNNYLPIIIVITQNYDDNKTEIMEKIIQEEFKDLNRDIKIMPVIAKDYVQKKKNKEDIYKKEGIDELIKISFEKSQKAVYPACLKSITEKTVQAFNLKTEEKKTKIKRRIKGKVPNNFK